MLPWIALAIFIVVFALIVFEAYEKVVLAMLGALIMIGIGALTFEQAIEAVKFETLLLLMGMMLLVEMARESGIFSWITLKIARRTKGNPLLLFCVLTLTTAVTSAFLDNVTTILLIVPITIELVRGTGRDPRPYILAEIFFSNLGGAATLIGDSANIIIGSSAGLTFNQFLVNMGPVVLVSIATVLGIFLVTHWTQHFRPIASDLRKLFLNHLMIRKIEGKFWKGNVRPRFMLKAASVIVLTILGFVLQESLGLSVAVIALLGAVTLMIIAAKEVDIHVSLGSVEWSTLLFFAGLFVMIGGLEHVGLLEKISGWIVAVAGHDYLTLLLVILWVTGFTSMVVDNVPFVTLMVPVIFGIQETLPLGVDPNLLWWALALGAVFGGNGTIVGASANVVGTGLAQKHGIKITFFEFMKYGFPLSITIMTIASFYLALRV